MIIITSNKTYRECIESFLDDCISCGKVVHSDSMLRVTHDQEIEIEDILMRCSDKKAKQKIRLILDKG